MSKKRLCLVVLLGVLLNILICTIIKVDFVKDYKINLSLSSNQDLDYQVYYSNDGSYGEANSTKLTAIEKNKEHKLSFNVLDTSSFIRLDLGDQESEIKIKNVTIEYLKNVLKIDQNLMIHSDYTNNILDIKPSNDLLIIKTGGIDSFIELNLNKIEINDFFETSQRNFSNITKIIRCIILDIFLIIILLLSNKIIFIMKRLYSNRDIIIKLTRNDLKNKYSGSYLGIFWAFVQPVVTVLIYVFVFQVGFKAAPLENDYPFVLWLIAGIIPWFFFAESLMNCSSCLIEYSYLVKKVVFKISILPIVKVMSSLFVHLFFIVLSIIIFAINGKMPGFNIIQVSYYTLCLIGLILAISYFTSAIVPFFKDFGQIINIFTQIGMWLTPIMWNQNMISENLRWILKINPMYYIVEGYRDSYIYGVWFWEKPKLTLYFWFITMLLFLIGYNVFKKLKVHFSDVL